MVVQSIYRRTDTESIVALSGLAGFDSCGVERSTILDALELYQGNRMQAARHLGLTWNALNRRCKKLGIDVKKRG